MTDAGGVPVAPEAAPDSPPSSTRVVLVTWLIYVVALLVLVASTYLPVWATIVVVTAVGVVTAVALWWMRTQADALGSTGRTARFLTAGAAVAVGGAVVAAWVVGGHPLGWLVFGVGNIWFGLAEVLAELSAQEWNHHLPVSCALVSVSAVLLGLGLTLVAFDSSVAGAWLAAAGVLTAPIGLYLLAQGRLWKMADDDAPPPSEPHRHWILLAVGIGALVVGGALMVLIGVPARFTVPITLVLSLLLVAISSNSRADVIAVVCAATIFVSLPTEVSATAEVVPQNGDDVVVVIGDSYTSGEGADEFFAGTNTRHDNECRRAPTAFAPELAKDPGFVVGGESIHRIVFVACSGAVAAEVDQRPQYPDEPLNRATGLDQLRNVAEVTSRLGLHVKMVVVGLGGNDAGFGDIGKMCLAPGDCSAIGGHFLDGLAHRVVRDEAQDKDVDLGVAPQLTRAFRSIDGAFPDVPVVVVPYPTPVTAPRDPDPGECRGVTLTDDERVFIRGFVDQLDAVEQRTAEKFGFFFATNMKDALLDSHEALCQGNGDHLGINYVTTTHPINGPLEVALNPLNWTHDSLHPTAVGHAAMKQALADWIGENAQRIEAPRERPRSTQTDAEMVDDIAAPIPTIEAVMADGGSTTFHACQPDGSDRCELRDSSWLVDQVVKGYWVLIPLGLIAIGGYVLALFLLRNYRIWRGMPAPPGG